MTADPAGADLRAEAVAVARSWIGTPYRHGASRQGAGADCLGLIRGVWRALYGREPAQTPPYTDDWNDASGAEALLETARRVMVEIPRPAAGSGDLLLFRMREGAPAKHLGLRAEAGDGAPTVVHAYSGRGVVESALGPALARRIAAAFRLPGRAG